MLQFRVGVLNSRIKCVFVMNMRWFCMQYVVCKYISTIGSRNNSSSIKRKLYMLAKHAEPFNTKSYNYSVLMFSM